MLAPTLFNLFFNAVIRMAIDDNLEEGRGGGGGVQIVFHPNTNLIDDKKMTL